MGYLEIIWQLWILLLTSSGFLWLVQFLYSRRFLQEMGVEFDDIDKRFDLINVPFDRIDKLFDRIDEWLDRINA